MLSSGDAGILAMMGKAIIFGYRDNERKGTDGGLPCQLARFRTVRDKSTMIERTAHEKNLDRLPPLPGNGSQRIKAIC